MKTGFPVAAVVGDCLLCAADAHQKQMFPYLAYHGTIERMLILLG